MKLPAPIKPRPVAAVTPTGAEALRSCPLRAAFDASPDHRELVFRGPAARLGSACHAVLEATAKGHFDNVAVEQFPAAFEQLWRAQVGREEAAALRSPLEQHFGPAERWPYYALKRAFLYRQARLLAEARHAVPRAQGDSQGEARVERQYVGFGGRLRGRADLVEQRDGHVDIVDYKSGAIFDVDASHASEPELKAVYRRQLLLYAALHWDETGVWPEAAHAISLQGDRASIQISPADALDLARETLGLLGAYNSQVAAGVPPSQMARPSQAACRHCPYKSMCDPFWDAVAPGWEMNDGAYIAGTVAAVQDFGPGGRTLEIDACRGNLPPGRYRLRSLSPVRFPDLNEVAVGSQVRVLGARIEDLNNPLDLLPSGFTQLWWEA